ncbi:MAG: hypothetical protein V3U37_03975, partial [Nitrospinaceae bacterium]
FPLLVARAFQPVRTGWKACPTKTFNWIFQFQNEFLEVPFTLARAFSPQSTRREKTDNWQLTTDNFLLTLNTR